MTTNPTRSALVILSGGQDSSTCLLWAKHVYEEVHAITFDYGQKHRVEIEAAKKVAALVGVASHAVVDVRGLLLGRSPLIDPATPLETYNDFGSMDKVIGTRVELTFVPLRNMLFLVVAANHALAKNCHTLITGVCAMDNANYPDCTEPFIHKAEAAMREALGMNRVDYVTQGGQQLEVVTPLLFLTKDQTVDLAATYEGWEQVLAETHTCYAGQVPPCGKCHACVLRAEGFRLADTVDPLVAKWEKSYHRCPTCPEPWGTGCDRKCEVRASEPTHVSLEPAGDLPAA
jgi:7-cyano-7-deazaguanine synthase